MRYSKSLLFLSAIAIAGCDKPETEASAPAQSVDAWFVESPPASAQPIHVVRADARPGDEVTVSGKVMGRTQPFVDGRAAFVLGDTTTLTPCNERPDDECTTPWDVCCDSKEDIREGTATIQIVGENGRVVAQGLKGVKGLKELSTVTVSGTVAESSTPEALVIDASALHVEN